MASIMTVNSTTAFTLSDMEAIGGASCGRPDSQHLAAEARRWANDLFFRTEIPLPDDLMHLHGVEYDDFMEQATRYYIDS